MSARTAITATYCIVTAIKFQITLIVTVLLDTSHHGSQSQLGRGAASIFEKKLKKIYIADDREKIFFI